MIVRVTFNQGILTVFKDDVEIPEVKVKFTKDIERPPTEVNIRKKKDSIGVANADFTAIRWEFRCEVPEEMEVLVNTILS